MSYEKYTWQTGEVITADKLNHMEEGILVGNMFLVEYNASDGEINASYNQLIDKINDGYLIGIYAITSRSTYGYASLYVLTNLSYDTGVPNDPLYRAVFASIAEKAESLDGKGVSIVMVFTSHDADADMSM